MTRSAMLPYAVLLTTSLASGVVHAQEASPAAPPAASQAGPKAASVDELEEVVVTAQKRAERLSDVPLSITAATGDQLQKQGITDPGGLEKLVPGFIFTKSAYSAPIYNIRGVGSYDEAIGISPAVSVYVDQVPLPFSRMTEGASLDLERVEALKGPQGTLFGQNSTGGAINYIANKPTDTFEAGVELTVGRFSQADAGGFISGPIATNLNARLAVRTEHRGDWQQSYTRDDSLGKRDFSSARLLVDFRPTDKLRFEFGASGWYNKSETQAKRKIGYSQISPGGYPNAPGFPTLQADLQAYPNAPTGSSRAADWNPGADYTRDDSFHQFSFHADWDLSDKVTLTSITSDSRLKVFTPNDNDGTDRPNSYSIIRGSADVFAQELRLAGLAGSRDQLRWMFGGSYEHDKTSDTQDLGINASNSGIGPFRWNGLHNLNDQKVDTKAVFGSLDYALTGQLTVQGSIRYTKQDRDYHGCLADKGNGQLAAAFSFLSTNLSGSPTVIPAFGCVTLDPVTNKPLTNGIYDSLDQDNLSWRAGLSWKPANDVLLYANVTKGYKAGNFGTLPAIRPVQAAPVTQEALLAYEAGFKTSLLNRTAQLSGAVFYYDYSHKQLLGSVNVGAPFGTLPGGVSVPKSHIAGAELEGTIRPAHGLTIRGGATYVASKVEDHFLLANPLGGASIDIGGERFPNTPKWQLTADAEYDFDVSEDWSGFVGGSFSFRSATKSFFTTSPLLNVPSYALVDLRAGVERPDGSLRLEVWGRNVTDKVYRTFATRVTDTVTETVGLPSTYGVMLRTKF